jgi:uncharacterized membrane protein YgcG
VTAVVILILSLFSLPSVFATDFLNGDMKLTINEKTGRFSVFYLRDPEKKKYQNLLWTKDAKTSYLAVQLNSRIYKMGNTNYFKTDIRGTQENPILVFESPMLSVSLVFSFISTPNHDRPNGIRIDMIMQNWGERDIEAGMKLVLDTYFGEKKAPHFKTDLRYIATATVMNRVVPDSWWLSKDKHGSLMGSIFMDGIYNPDLVHLANWRRLNDSRWKLPYVMQRNFNSLPFSVRDTAVAYFMETETLARWDQRIMTVMLATEDSAGFGLAEMGVGRAYAPGEYRMPIAPIEKEGGGGSSSAAAASGGGGGGASSGGGGESSGSAPIIINNVLPAPAPAPVPAKPSVLLPSGSLRLDILTLRELIYKIDAAIYFGVDVSEEELRAMESLVAGLRSRYGSVFGGIGLFGTLR